MREIARMVPVITHAVTNRLLFVRDLIYVLQKRCLELGIVLGFPHPQVRGAPPIALQRTTAAQMGKFEREVFECEVKE